MTIPLKQGLKHGSCETMDNNYDCLNDDSIKTRIETRCVVDGTKGSSESE